GVIRGVNCRYLIAANSRGTKCAHGVDNRSSGRHFILHDDHVIVVEDEVTSGRTIINTVRALRAAGIRCDQVATIYAADDPEMRARVAAEGIRLHAASLCQADSN